MPDIESSLENLNKEDTYSMLLLLLFASTDNPRYAILSELPFILDHDSFIRFIKYFEGQKIEIPTIQHTKDSLRLLELYQYCKVEKMPWHDAIKRAGFSDSESWSAKIKLDRFSSQLDKFKFKLGGLVKNADFNK